jgi:plastocyanin
MMRYRLFTMRGALLAALLLLLAQGEMAQAQNKKNPYACVEPDPTAYCTARTTCGSASTPCSIDVKRTSDAASATPSIPGAKGNSPFCVKAGTTVVWKSETKHQGFVVDMGTNSPFAVDDIIGGSDRSVKTVAKKPGCYRYSAGACLSGAIYGMCGSSYAELIVTN